MRSTAIRVSALALALLAAAVTAATAQSGTSLPRQSPEGDGGAALFKEAATREATLRRELSAAKSGAPAATQQRVRTLVGSFEDLARLFPTAGQADKALWQGASLSADLFFQAGNESDRARAVDMIASLTKSFPASSYARQSTALARRLGRAPHTTGRDARGNTAGLEGGSASFESGASPGEGARNLASVTGRGGVGGAHGRAP